MNVFSHILDEGIRKFLEDKEVPSDFNVVASQLDAALKALDYDAEDLEIPFQVLEEREAYYDEACEYFGWRNLKAVRESLRNFWRV